MSSFNENYPSNRYIGFGDTRLTRAINGSGLKCASINDYAKVTGIPISDLLDMFDEHMENHLISLEFAGGEVFVHTAPFGRDSFSKIPANMWETLRKFNDVETSYELWRSARELEAIGWEVEYDIHKITGNTNMATSVGFALGLKVNSYVAPILEFPSLETLTSHQGPLDSISRRGYPLVAVVCASRSLDKAVTLLRLWFIRNFNYVSSDILVLEKPHLQPLLMRRADGGIVPESVTVALTPTIKQRPY